MSLDEFRVKAGFPVDDLVRQIKNELGVKKCRVFFDNPYAQAMSRYATDGVLEVHLPTLEIILQQRPELTREEAVAKIKAQVAEELCHGVYHETDHTDQVVACTLKEMRDHMTPQELQTPYIREKIARIKQASNTVSGMAIRR